MQQQLKYLLYARGIRREDVAKVWNCNVMTVSNKLNGKTPIYVKELKDVAIAYNFSNDEILSVIRA